MCRNSLDEIEEAQGYITAEEVLSLVRQLRAARDLADAFEGCHYDPVTECGGFLRDALDGHVDKAALEGFLFPHRRPGGQP